MRYLPSGVIAVPDFSSLSPSAPFFLKSHFGIFLNFFKLAEIGPKFQMLSEGSRVALGFGPEASWGARGDWLLF